MSAHSLRRTRDPCFAVVAHAVELKPAIRRAVAQTDPLRCTDAMAHVAATTLWLFGIMTCVTRHCLFLRFALTAVNCRLGIKSDGGRSRCQVEKPRNGTCWLPDPLRLHHWIAVPQYLSFDVVRMTLQVLLRTKVVNTDEQRGRQPTVDVACTVQYSNVKGPP